MIPERRQEQADRRQEHRRKKDRRWVVHIRENWYRDVWLLIISMVVVATGFVAVNASNHADSLATRIQANRIETIREQCVDQNNRNMNTISELNVLIGGLPPREQAQAKATESFTIDLLNALVPVRDCKAVVRAASVTN